MQDKLLPLSKPMMTIQESVQVCLRKYADFSGRATRAEFWWWLLATTLVSFAISAIDTAISTLLRTLSEFAFSPFSTIFGLAILLPNLAVTARRLHDIGKSGWWQLVWFVIAGAGWILFVIGIIITIVRLVSGDSFSGVENGDFFANTDFADFVPALVTFLIAMLVSLAVFVWYLIWLVRQGDYGANRYGPDPRAIE